MDLTGKLLIAMPGMSDPRFEHSVVFMCRHSAEGAMGVIVNKPTRDVRLSDLLDQFDIAVGPRGRDAPVHFGGPVENARGFVLHTADYAGGQHMLRIGDGFRLSATLDVLEDIAGGVGPSRALVLLGYAGWGPGQLEREIGLNAWLTAEATTDLVHDRPDPEKWESALKSLGVDPLTLSASAGHA